MGLILSGLIIVLLIFAPMVIEELGGYSFKYTALFQTLFSPDRDFLLATYDWTEKSVGQLLIPNNPLQGVIL